MPPTPDARPPDDSGPLPQFEVDSAELARPRGSGSPGAASLPGPDERIDEPLPSLVRLALERAQSFGPVTIREVTGEIDVPLDELQVTADESGQLVAVTPVARLWLMAGLVVFAAVVVAVLLSALL